MELNPNYLKTIMLILENEVIQGEDVFIDILTYYNYISIYSINFDEEDFLEYLNHCIASELILGKSYTFQNIQVFQVNSITSTGYKFLINSKDHFIWNEALKIFNKTQIKTIYSLTKILEETFFIEVSKIIKNL